VAFPEVPVSAYLRVILCSPIAGKSNGSRRVTVVVVVVIPVIGGSVKCTRHCTMLQKCWYSMTFAN